mmetsp:Transcript_1735/g.2687  ORF Transcript_1735/g.2687 Transcript_1735/m.2687 type:complete len:100 (+) Transcript_1735:61-360(+)
MKNETNKKGRDLGITCFETPFIIAHLKSAQTMGRIVLTLHARRPLEHLAAQASPRMRSLHLLVPSEQVSLAWTTALRGGDAQSQLEISNWAIDRKRRAF